MTVEDLQVPPTEIELGELTTASQKVLTEAGMNLLRRLAFSYNVLKDRVAAAEKRIDEQGLDGPTLFEREVAKLQLPTDIFNGKGGSLVQNKDKLRFGGRRD